MRHVDWLQAYEAFRALGITKVAFHQTHFAEFCRAGKKPALKTLYLHFRAIEAEQRAGFEAASAQPENADSTSESAASVRPIGRSLQIAEADPAVIERALRKPGARSVSVSSAMPAPFRLTLGDGSCMEFETHAPEQLALQFFLLARRSS